MRNSASLLATLRGGRMYDLEQPRYAGAPTFEAHAPGYVYSLHRRHEAGLGERRTSASGLIVTADHSGTHIDALCHQAEDLTLSNGLKVDADIQTSKGFTELGVDTIEPIVARCVLLDVARAAGVPRLPDGHLISAEELEQTQRWQGSELRPADVVLVRTGNGTLWADPDTYLAGPGLGAEAATWLAGKRPLAVGADNVAIDVVGSVSGTLGLLPCHTILLVRNGVYLIENLLLEQLASDEAYESVFLCAPLKLRGATGSPVRPIAFTV